MLASDLLIFCPVNHIVGRALDNNALASPHLMNAEHVFTVKNLFPAQYTPDWARERGKYQGRVVDAWDEVVFDRPYIHSDDGSQRENGGTGWSE